MCKSPLKLDIHLHLIVRLKIAIFIGRIVQIMDLLPMIVHTMLFFSPEIFSGHRSEDLSIASHMHVNRIMFAHVEIMFAFPLHLHQLKPQGSVDSIDLATSTVPDVNCHHNTYWFNLLYFLIKICLHGQSSQHLLDLMKVCT